MLQILALMAAAPPPAPGVVPASPALAPWPQALPEKVTRTPDWSDYRLYPDAARRKNQEGMVTAQLLIGTDGVPSECRIVQSSGFRELDAGNCALMMMMRFVPAHDASGAAVASTYQRRIGWLLAERRRFGSAGIDIDVRRGTDGKQACAVAGTTGRYRAIWSTLACSVMLDTPYFLHSAAPTDQAFRVAVRLNAGDTDPLASMPWPAGTPIAAETVRFVVGANGDPSDCKPSVSQGWGPRGLNNLSPCGRFVSALWLKARPDQPGVVETRVYRAQPSDAPPPPAQTAAR